METASTGTSAPPSSAQDIAALYRELDVDRREGAPGILRFLACGRPERSYSAMSLRVGASQAGARGLTEISL